MNERLYQGLGASSGVAIGTVYLYEAKIEKDLIERDISDEEIPQEIKRFRKALDLTKKQIQAIISLNMGKFMEQDSLQSIRRPTPGLKRQKNNRLSGTPGHGNSGFFMDKQLYGFLQEKPLLQFSEQLFPMLICV